MSASTSDLFAVWADLWIPPKRLPLSQWAEENFVLSPEYSAVTGRLRLHGYQREPFDAFTDPRVSEVVLKVGTQVLKTLFIQCAMAYVASEDPGPTLVSQPKEDDAETFSKERLVPMIRDIPALQGRIANSASRKSSSTTLYKEFAGGSWSMVGAGAAGNAARRSIRYYFADEINIYDPLPQGNFVDLADERTATYGSRAKRIYCCSPTTPDGEISKKYEESDQRKPWAACWACHERQILKWSQVAWDHDVDEADQPQTARYRCEHCGVLWNDIQRWKSADESIWIAERPFRGVAGFWLNHLYSPSKTLAQMVKKWIALSRSKDQESLKAFINTNLAEEWVDKGEAPKWHATYNRAEDYRLGTVPSGGLFLTAGADVQKDRVEIDIYAWGRNRESWLIDHSVLGGDPSRPEVWQKVSEQLNATYRHELGQQLSIVRFAIDTKYATNDVYAWVRAQGPGRVMAVKGVSTGAAALGHPSAVEVTSKGKKISRGVKSWPVNGAILKSQFYGWLNLDPSDAPGESYPHGYCHYPKGLPEEFFQQLVAESLKVRTVKGYRKYEWVKDRERNEALDMRVYNTAAAIAFGIERFREHNWAALEGMLKPEPKAVVPSASPSTPTPQPPPAPAPVRRPYYQPVKSGFMNR